MSRVSTVIAMFLSPPVWRVWLSALGSRLLIQIGFCTKKEREQSLRRPYIFQCAHHVIHIGACAGSFLFLPLFSFFFRFFAAFFLRSKQTIWFIRIPNGFRPLRCKCVQQGRNAAKRFVGIQAVKPCDLILPLASKVFGLYVIKYKVRVSVPVLVIAHTDCKQLRKLFVKAFFQRPRSLYSSTVTFSFFSMSSLSTMVKVCAACS